MTENKTYRASYHIKHGVTHGFGIVYDDESDEKLEFNAENIKEALKKSIGEARSFARTYIAAPNGNTAVTLVELCEKNGRIIDVLAEVQKLQPLSNDVKSLLFPDGTHYMASCSWIEHVLALEEIEKKLR